MNGVLLVDKPCGLTSHDVVAKVRRALGTRAVGHAGTLDPLASGLLVMLIGEGTKVSDYLLNGDKSYEVLVRLGIKTDSMDMTGQVIEERDVPVTEAEVERAAQALTGAIELAVPVHSAVKVNGKRLYKFAHKGEQPEEIPMRVMDFQDIAILEVTKMHLRVRMRCSKGSFVRAWVDRFGEILGCGGAVEELRRLKSEPFSVDQAVTLSRLEEGNLESAWIELGDCLPHLSRLVIHGRDETLLMNGQISRSMETELLRFVRVGEALPAIRVVSRERNDLLALLTAEQGQFYKIRRVFNRV